MPRVLYEKWTPGPETISVIAAARSICAEYQEAGYDLTLRQLYYQFVARGLIPNTQRDYKRLGDIVNKARLAGLLDWDYIVDRTRNLEHLSHWSTPGDIMASAAKSYRLDKWSGQPYRVEVWVEKEALAGVVSRTADRNDVAWFSCRGYVSQSEIWGAAQRHGEYIAGGQGVVVLHLGDHDPSGIDMTRDIERRLRLFIYQDWYNANEAELRGMFDGRISQEDVEAHVMAHLEDRTPIEVRRIALNRDQVEQYDPPPNPAKLSDSRAEGYIVEHGDESWELDALPPDVLDALITEAIEDVLDDDAYSSIEATEAEQRKLLERAAIRWQDVATFLDGDTPKGGE